MKVQRHARAVNGRPAVEVGKLGRVCPRCKAAVGWKCTKKIGDQVLPRADTHPERRQPRDG